MAVIYQYLPDVPLWQVMVVGLLLAAGGLVLSHLMYARGMGLQDLWYAVMALTPIAAPVAVLFALFVHFLELLVAFLQAYIFTMLTAQFIGLSVHPAH